jgi:hypothetical protein
MIKPNQENSIESDLRTTMPPAKEPPNIQVRNEQGDYVNLSQQDHMRLSMGHTSMGLDVSKSILSQSNEFGKVPKIDIIVGAGGTTENPYSTASLKEEE